MRRLVPHCDRCDASRLESCLCIASWLMVATVTVVAACLHPLTDFWLSAHFVLVAMCAAAVAVTVGHIR